MIDIVEKNTELISAIITIVALFLVWQFIRYSVMYFENTVKGRLSENVGKNLRIEFL